MCGECRTHIVRMLRHRVRQACRINKSQVRPLSKLRTHRMRRITQQHGSMVKHLLTDCVVICRKHHLLHVSQVHHQYRGVRIQGYQFSLKTHKACRTRCLNGVGGQTPEHAHRRFRISRRLTNRQIPHHASRVAIHLSQRAMPTSMRRHRDCKPCGGVRVRRCAGGDG